MSPPWQDERIGILKSAVQKHTRRGETGGAYAAVTRLLALPGGRSALRRRLPVIAAEDVGWWWIPAASVSDDGPLADAELLRTVTSLSSLPKSREAYHLADTVWDGRFPVRSVSGQAFRDALAAGDHRTALALALAAREARQWRSGERLIDPLLGALQAAPEAAGLIGNAALRREAMGGSGTDELMAAAVIAAIDRPSGPLPELPYVASPPASSWQLPWYVIDSHSEPGRRAIRRVAMRKGMPFQMLAELQFSHESVRLGPAELPSRWHAQAVEMDAVAYGWETHAQGAELWSVVRSEVRAEIERELRDIRL